MEQIEDKKSTKERILDVAIDLFSQKGYMGVSIREITREVGIKESSLYNHFKNKEEILETIFTLFRQQFVKTLPPTDKINDILTASSIQQFLEMGFARFKAHIDDSTNEKMWRILYIEHYREPLAREIFLSDIIRKTLDFLEDVFKLLIKKGKIKPLCPKLLASEYQYPMFAMLAEYNMLRFDGKDTYDIEKKMREHMQYFIDTVQNDNEER